MAISQAADLVVPLFSGFVIDAITWSNIDDVYWYSIGMAGVTTVSTIASYFRVLSFSIMSERISRDLSNDVFASIVHKDVSFFDEKKIGEFLSRLSSDITIIKNGLGVNVAMLIWTIFLLVIMLIILFVISWQLTLVMLASLAPTWISISIYS